MKRRLKKFKAPKSDIILKNQKLIIITLIVISGFFIGSIALKYPNELFIKNATDIVANLYNQQISQSILKNFIQYMFSEVCFMFAAFVFGMCVIGQPFLWVIPFIRSLEAGFIMSVIYQNFSLKGLGYCLLIIIPSSIIAIATLIVACKESILMTKDINGVIKKKNSISNSNNIIKLYIERYGILLLGTVFASLIYTLTVQLFAGRFNFSF